MSRHQSPDILASFNPRVTQVFTGEMHLSGYYLILIFQGKELDPEKSLRRRQIVPALGLGHSETTKDTVEESRYSMLPHRLDEFCARKNFIRSF